MTRAHITDTEDNSKLKHSSEKFAQDTIKNSYENTAGMSKAATAAIAALAAMLSKLAMEGIKGIFNRFQNRDRQNNSPDIGNRLSRNITQRLGNKSRGLLRGGKAKTVSKLGRIGNRFNKTAKVARAGKNASSVVKAGRLAKTANTAVKTAKLAKTASTAVKVAKVAKLARFASLARGGMVIAGGPVGIGLFAASIVAPIAIEAVWKNKEKIYDGGKNLVNKSKLKTQDIMSIVKGKRSQVDEIIPEAENLKVVGDNKQVLLETDSKGKVVTNNFDPNHKLAFYQEKEGQNTMLLDEAEIDGIAPQEQSANGEMTQNDTVAANVQSGTGVIKETLTQLKQNNLDSPEIQQQADFLGGNIEAAEAQPQIAGVRDSIKLNEAGSSIVNLFNTKAALTQSQSLETQDYTISRRGNDYFLKDKEGSLLLQATNTGFGSKVLSANLNPSQLEDLSYLKQDLRLGMGITGGFASSEPATKTVNPAQAEKPEQNLSQAAPQSDKPQEQINSQTAIPPKSAFSQYLPQEDKVPTMAGNTKEQSNDMER